MTAPAVNQQVWYRPGRMHGYPEQEPVRGTITSVGPNGRVYIELGGEGLGVVSGVANYVAHRDSMTPELAEQFSYWWEA